MEKLRTFWYSRYLSIYLKIPGKIKSRCQLFAKTIGEMVNVAEACISDENWDPK
jgi:hypothetical protein